MSKSNKLIFIFVLLSSIGVNSFRILQSSKAVKEAQVKSLQISFDQYIVKYKKTYENEDEKIKRLRIFETNVNKMKESRCSACGVNKFTDQTDEEIQEFRGIKIGQNSVNSYLATSQTSPSPTMTAATSPQNNSASDSSGGSSSQVPKQFDWRDYGVVTSIKNQLKCGACWAFSTCAFYESQLIRRGQARSSIDLSEQYLLQCDTLSNGCQGGNLYSPMDLVLSNGIPFESSYPYNPQFGYLGICRAGRGPIFPFSSRVTVYNLSDSQLVQYLLQRPLNIGIKSNEWQKYSPTDEDRTFECKEIKQGIKEFNHAVLLVGYTETEWIVKNQWGEDWGVNGFIYITKNTKYNCGIGLEINTLNFQLKSVINSTKSVATNEKNQIESQNIPNVDKNANFIHSNSSNIQSQNNRNSILGKSKK